jgi:hypothetical protein
MAMVINTMTMCIALNYFEKNNSLAYIEANAIKKAGWLLVLIAILTPAAFASHVDWHGCMPCHTPHHAASEPENDVPLWSGSATTGAFTMYSSPSMDATQPTGPTGSSKLCLSCHDGTAEHTWQEVLDENGDPVLDGNGDPVLEPKDSNFQTDLSHSHPVSIDYQEAIDNGDATLRQVASVTPGYLRIGDDGVARVQCASCHDPHNSGIGEAGLRGYDWYDGGYPLEFDGDGSSGGDLCLECHIK